METAAASTARFERALASMRELDPLETQSS